MTAAHVEDRVEVVVRLSAFLNEEPSGAASCVRASPCVASANLGDRLWAVMTRGPTSSATPMAAHPYPTDNTHGKNRRASYTAVLIGGTTTSACAIRVPGTTALRARRLREAQTGGKPG